jgi:hypothetical protein
MSLRLIGPCQGAAMWLLFLFALVGSEHTRAGSADCQIRDIPALIESFIRSGDGRLQTLPRSVFVDQVVDQKILARAYQCIEGAMLKGYARAQMPSLDRYRNWYRTTDLPFLSPGVDFGYSYVYVGGNESASRMYRDALVSPEKPRHYPVGTTIVKESFDLTPIGEVIVNAAFIMEKMASPSGVWKFTEVSPEGEVVLSRLADAAGKVRCLECHGPVAKTQDFLLYLPKVLPRRLRKNLN